MCENCNCIHVPNTDIVLHPGDMVTLGRFSCNMWRVCYGWFSFDDNRAILCWFLQDVASSGVSKPLFQIDLDDIVVITHQ